MSSVEAGTGGRRRSRAEVSERILRGAPSRVDDEVALLQGPLEVALLVVSLASTASFFIYGFNMYYLLRLRRRYSPPRRAADALPEVAVHLPIYNEMYVVERLLAACAGCADGYGRERVHISVLDDSDDGTTEVARRLAESYRERGYRVDVLHREDRAGYKAGALNRALAETGEALLVVFDSDFVPRPDFLERAVSYICADDRLGVVQFRWSYTNREYNWVTKSVSIGMEAHFLIEQPARCAGGLFLNFNGSAGIIRTEALRESGGWQQDTLAEDLDASYRMQLRGHRVQYVDDDVPCEVPPTVSSFKRQQARWARGSLQVAKKSLPTLLARPDIGAKKKFEALVHLTYYAVHPLMFFAFVIAVLSALSGVDVIGVVLPSLVPSAAWVAWVLIGLPIAFCTVAVWIYYVTAMRLRGDGVLRSAPYLFVLLLLGYGISASNTIEAAKALLLRRSGSFRRTPKYAILGRKGSWRDKRYQVPLDPSTAVEAGCAALAFFAIAAAALSGNYGIVPILALYGASYSFVPACTILQKGRELEGPPPATERGRAVR